MTVASIDRGRNANRDKEDLNQQKKLVEQFMREEFHDAQTGTNGRASVNPGQLMERLQQADEFGAALDPLLRPQVQRADEVDATAAERRAALPSRLVLVSRDQTQVPVLSEVLLGGELPYVAPIRERLRLYAAEVRPQWLGGLRDEQQTVARRFRAALELAGLDGNAGGVEWTAADKKFIAEELSKSFAENQPQLRDLMRPLAEQLIPALDTLFDAEGSTADQQVSAAMTLADYAGSDGERMARLLTRANQRQTEILYPKVAEYKSGLVRDGLLALTKEQPDENLGQLDRVRLGRRQANAAIALLRQGERDLYFDALRITDDPESLSQFISRCKNWGVTAEELLRSLGRSRVLRSSATGEDRRVEARVMYGLLLAFGSYSLEQIAEADREPLIADLRHLYVEDPSAAVHSASGWLLRTWGREAEVLKLDEVEVPYDASGVRECFRLRITVEPLVRSVVVHKGKPQIISLTFIVFPLGVYQTGSPEWEEERQENETVRVVNISKPFALCDREVRRELHDLIGERPWRKQVSENMGWELGENDAAMTEAVAWEQFCDRLTVFLFGTDEDFQGDHAPETLAEDNRKPLYRKLHLHPGGFRMPTEWEWEVGARSGQQTPWSFGSDVGLLGDYAWYSENSGNRSREVCLKRPTIGGLHDVHGNLLELTDDTNGELDRGILSVGRKPRFRGVLPRGGSWSVDAANCRLANRNGIDSRGRNMGRGFRLALSLPVVSPALKEELSTTPDER